MGIINSIKFRDKMYKRLRLTGSSGMASQSNERHFGTFVAYGVKRITAFDL